MLNLLFHRTLKFLKLNLKLSVPQIIVLVFGLLIIFGGLLLSLPISSASGERTGFIDSLFTATSAVCVTGLVIFDTYSHWSFFGKAVILILIQLGGLGFMTFATLFSFILKRTISMRERMIMAESLNVESLDGIVRLVRHILIGTLLIEGVGALILSVRFSFDFGIWNGIKKGVFHSISAFCNAGFDILGEKTPFVNLTEYTGDWVINITIMALIIIGGLGFIVWEAIYLHSSHAQQKLGLHSKMVLIISAFLIIFGAAFIFIFEYQNPYSLKNLSFPDKILASLFQSVTCRTAGFNTLNLAGLKQETLFIMIILMFIGGSPGSTAGGIKTTTLGVIFCAVIASIRGANDINLYGRMLTKGTVLRAVAILVIGFLILIFGTVFLLAVQEVDFLSALFEVTSAFGTVGLTVGITPDLNNMSKIVIMATMFLGRIGVLTSAMAISIRMNKKTPKIKYPMERVMVG